MACLVMTVFRDRCRSESPAASFSDVVAKAAAARDANDLPGAIELYQQALKLNSQWPDGWWFLGSLQYRAGDYAAAGDAAHTLS